MNRHTDSLRNHQSRGIDVLSLLVALVAILVITPPAHANDQFAAYWEVSRNTEAYIELANNSDLPAVIQPVLLVRGRSVVSLPETEVPAASRFRLSLNETLSPTDIPSWGSAILEGDTGSVVGLVVSQNDEDSIQFESTFSPSDQTASDLVAQWWLPHATAQAFFVVQNTSSYETTLVPRTFTDTGVIEGRPIRLRSNESIRIPLSSLSYLFNGQRPQMGHMEFVQIGGSSPRAPLIGRVYVVSRSLGLSLGFDMAKPDQRSSTELQMAGGPSGMPGPGLGFPEGMKFVGHTLVSNLSPNPVQLVATVYGHHPDGNPGSVVGEPVVLDPHETRMLDLSWSDQDLAESGFRAVGLQHSGAPRDVAAIGFSVDEDYSSSLVCPFQDIDKSLTHKMAISFDLAEGRTSLFLIKNTSDEVLPFTYFLLFDSAGDPQIWVAHGEHLAPQELRVVDVKKLRDSQALSIDGKSLPADLEYGGAIIVAANPSIIAADPIFDFETANVRLCGAGCCSGPECPPSPPVGCDNPPSINIIVVGPRNFSLLQEIPTGGGRFTCKYKMCEGGSCSSGPWTLTDQPFCWPGARGEVIVIETNFFFFVIRKCEALSWDGLSIRPCI